MIEFFRAGSNVGAEPRQMDRKIHVFFCDIILAGGGVLGIESLEIPRC